jgi:hypothetical protein
MELLDRYLESVRRYLPWKQQNDLLAELRVNLESQLEEREAELGRPLTRAEAEAWLLEIGSPLQVAARYQPQQYLIGPALFPVYRLVLRNVCFWLTLGYLIVGGILLATGPFSAARIAHEIVWIPWQVGIAAAIVTLIFALIELSSTHYPEQFGALAQSRQRWSPGELPPIPRHSGEKRQRSYAGAIAQVVFGFLFLGWWLLVPYYHFLLIGPIAVAFDASPFTFAPVWVLFYWWVVVLNLIQVLWRLIDLYTGAWQGSRSLQNLVVEVLGLIPLILLANAPGGQYILLKHPMSGQSGLEAQMADWNRLLHSGFCLALAIVLIKLILTQGLAFYRNWRQRQASA